MEGKLAYLDTLLLDSPSVVIPDPWVRTARPRPPPLQRIPAVGDAVFQHGCF